MELDMRDLWGHLFGSLFRYVVIFLLFLASCVFIIGTLTRDRVDFSYKISVSISSICILDNLSCPIHIGEIIDNVYERIQNNNSLEYLYPIERLSNGSSNSSFIINTNDFFYASPTNLKLNYSQTSNSNLWEIVITGSAASSEDANLLMYLVAHEVETAINFLQVERANFVSLFLGGALRGGEGDRVDGYELAAFEIYESDIGQFLTMGDFTGVVANPVFFDPTDISVTTSPTASLLVRIAVGSGISLIAVFMTAAVSAYRTGSVYSAAKLLSLRKFNLLGSVGKKQQREASTGGAATSIGAAVNRLGSDVIEFVFCNDARLSQRRAISNLMSWHFSEWKCCNTNSLEAVDKAETKSPLELSGYGSVPFVSSCIYQLPPVTDARPSPKVATRNLKVYVFELGVTRIDRFIQFLDNDTDDNTSPSYLLVVV